MSSLDGMIYSDYTKFIDDHYSKDQNDTTIHSSNYFVVFEISILSSKFKVFLFKKQI